MGIMEKMTTRVKDLAVSLGAVSVGISTLETLAGGPPSADLTYVQPSAKSAISFAVPLHQEYIEPFLRKEDRLSHERDNIRTNTQISGMSLEISSYLRQKGFPAVPLCANIEYRTETPNGVFDEKPPLSHRYLAVRSGKKMDCGHAAGAAGFV
jgi:epoxyqueuosine reductase